MINKKIKDDIAFALYGMLSFLDKRIQGQNNGYLLVVVFLSNHLCDITF